MNNDHTEPNSVPNSTLEELLRSGRAMIVGKKLYFKPDVTGADAFEAMRELIDLEDAMTESRSEEPSENTDKHSGS